MTEKEREQLSARIEKAAAEFFESIEKLTADVPEPTEEEKERNIRKIIEFIMDNELEKPLERMRTNIIDECLDVLIDEAQKEKSQA